VSGSVLRLVSVLLLTVVGGLSTARVLCVLPCLTETLPTHAASRSHCEHPSSEPATAIDAYAGACDACGDAGLVSADKIASRSSITVELTTTASAGPRQLAQQTFDLLPDAGPPPGLRTFFAARLPLRI